MLNGGSGEVVNTSDCGSDMRGFDPHESPHRGIAQLIEFSSRVLRDAAFLNLLNMEVDE